MYAKFKVAIWRCFVWEGLGILLLGFSFRKVLGYEMVHGTKWLVACSLVKWWLWICCKVWSSICLLISMPYSYWRSLVYSIIFFSWFPFLVKIEIFVAELCQLLSCKSHWTRTINGKENQMNKVPVFSTIPKMICGKVNTVPVFSTIPKIICGKINTVIWFVVSFFKPHRN